MLTDGNLAHLRDSVKDLTGTLKNIEVSLFHSWGTSCSRKVVSTPGGSSVHVKCVEDCSDHDQARNPIASQLLLGSSLKA